MPNESMKWAWSRVVHVDRCGEAKIVDEKVWQAVVHDMFEIGRIVC